MWTLLAFLLSPIASDTYDMGASGPSEHAHADRAIGPFTLTRAEQDGKVQLALILARPVTSNMRYEIAIDGASKVRNAGQVGPGGRVGATVCRLTFRADTPWRGNITIMDDRGHSESYAL